MRSGVLSGGEESSEESTFRYRDAVACLRRLTEDRAAAHPPMFRRHEGGFTHFRLEEGEVRRRYVEAVALPKSGDADEPSGAGSGRHQVDDPGQGTPVEAFHRIAPGFRRPAPPIADRRASVRPYRPRRQPPPTSATCQRKGRHRVRARSLVPEPWGPASARPGFPARGPDRCRASAPGRGCRGTRSRPAGPSDAVRR